MVAVYPRNFYELQLIISYIALSVVWKQYACFLTSGKIKISIPLLRIALEISPWEGSSDRNNLKRVDQSVVNVYTQHKREWLSKVKIITGRNKYYLRQHLQQHTAVLVHALVKHLARLIQPVALVPVSQSLYSYSISCTDCSPVANKSSQHNAP